MEYANHVIKTHCTGKRPALWYNPPEFWRQSGKLNPIEMLRPRVLCWLPYKQFPCAGKKPPCPKCDRTGDNIQPKSYSRRRITTLTGFYLLICRQFRCVNCPHSTASSRSTYFLTTNDTVLASLPPLIRRYFPCVLTRKAGVDRTVVHLLFSELPSARVAGILQTLHHATHMNKLVSNALFRFVLSSTVGNINLPSDLAYLRSP